MALRTSSAVVGLSTISPLRTARDLAWPTPMMLKAPFSPSSPTVAQILDVPMSKPTMMDDALNMLSFVRRSFYRLARNRWNRAGFQPAGRHVVRNRQIQAGEHFALALGQVVHQAPAQELPLDLSRTKGHHSALSR